MSARLARVESRYLSSPARAAGGEEQRGNRACPTAILLCEQTRSSASVFNQRQNRKIRTIIRKLHTQKRPYRTNSHDYIQGDGPCTRATYEIPGFGEQWVRRSMLVFGKLHPKLIGKELTPGALSALLRRAKISSQLLRPTITTASFRAGADFDEKAELAHKMGHSAGVQASVYNRMLS